MKDALLELTPDGQRDAAGWVRAHLTNDLPGKLMLAAQCDPNELIDSITYAAVQLLHADGAGDPMASLERLADGMDLGQPDEQATRVGLLLITPRGQREAVAWLALHLSFDAAGKAQLAARAHALELCESLTAVLVTLLGQGVGGPPLEFVDRMVAEAAGFEDDDAA